MLRGRDDVLSLVNRWLEGVGTGAGGALHLEGSPGVGKTALLEWATDHAHQRGYRLLHVTGHPEERATAWAGLSQLVTPHLSQLVHFDERPRNTLMRAMRLGDEGQVDEVSVGMSVLYLLTFSDEPTIVTIDDVQWLDDTSITVLRFVCRRLQSTGVGVLTAQHPSTGILAPHPVVLEPLSRDSLRAIARDLGAAAAVAELLVEHSEGLPLVLARMIEALDQEQLIGRRPLPEPLSELGRVDTALAQRMAALPDDTRRLLAAAALAPAQPLPVLAAAFGFTDLPRVLEPAKLAALVDAEPESLSFRHPTALTAAIHSVTPEQRRQIHRTLAGVSDVSHRGWHLAAAVEGPDDDAATALDALAVDAESRGAPLVALRARQRAMEVAATATPQRWIDATRHAIDARLPEVAKGYLAELGDDPTVEALRAETAWVAGDVGGARQRWTALANDPAMPQAVAIGSRRRAALAAFRMYDMIGVLGLTRRNDESAPSPDVIADDPILTVMDWGATAVIGRPHAVEHLLRLAADLLDRGPDPTTVAVLAEVATLALARSGRNAELSALGERISDMANEQAARVVPALLIARASHRSRSDLAGSVALAREALALAEEWDLREHRPFALALAAVGEASMDGPDAPALIEAMREFPVPVARAVADYAQALLHAGRDELAEALAVLGQLHSEYPVERSFGFYWHHDLVDIALRAGDRDLAERVSRDLGTVMATVESPWVEAAFERTCGLLASDRASAEQHLLRSIELFTEHGYDVTAGRVHLDLAERLRRDRQRSTARTHVEVARRSLAAAGARRWLERAEREAATLGLAPLESVDAAATVLTPRELQVARWLVAGMTFKQIATRLFLSPRTAEAHGQTVYRKLGVKGRAELAQLAARDSSLSASDR